MCDGGDGGGYGGGDYGSAIGSGEKASDYADAANNSTAIGHGEAATPASENNDTGFNGFGDSAPAVVMAAMNGIFNPSPGIDTPASASKPAASTTPSKSAEAYEKEKDSLRRNRRTTILASAGSGLGGKSTLLGQ
jgi:hypothetical protein